MIVLNVGKGLPRHFLAPETVISIDLWKPYLSRGDILADARHLPIRPNSVDAVFCIELIEHLEREEGLKLVKELKKIGKSIILSTPGGFFEQPELNGNPFQRHKSSYKRGDFPDFFFMQLGGCLVWVKLE